MKRAGVLRMLREVFGLSQEDIGKIIGVTGVHVCLVEQGRRRLSPERARKFVGYFRVSGQVRRELMCEITRQEA